MMQLSYNYGPHTKLYRGTFIVNVQLSAFDKMTEAVYQVTAPDQIFAQEIVRRQLDPLNDCITFWTYAIREVVTKRDGTTFIRPFMLNGHSVRFPYFNG